MIGGFIAANYLSPNAGIVLSESTKHSLSGYDIYSYDTAYLPTELFNVWSLKNMIIMIVGGILIGFGTRYANGCTSGHAISGLSNLQLPSLITVVGFFIGGLLMIHVLFPIIF